MTRVIAGTAGGRRLAVPPGNGTRPTSDRAREALFSTWESLRGTLRGARALDLYAGSGAVGLEALSRGAAHVLMVEADPRAARTVRANTASLGLPGAEVRAARAERTVEGPPSGEPYDIVFLDPPYEDGVAQRVVRQVVAKGWLAPAGLIVAEVAAKAKLVAPEGLEITDERRYGIARFVFLRPVAVEQPAS